MLSSDKQNFADRELVFTGERFIPQQSDPILALEHYHRYCAASRFVDKKRVLDIACGEGYGSAFLSQYADTVVGVDCDIATITHAKKRYASIPNLNFEVGNCADWGRDGDEFDAIVCFETIEHLDMDNQTAFLDRVRRILKQDGLFIVSSPERDEYAATSQIKNQCHKHEMTFSELREFLGTYFEYTYICAQRVLSLSTMWQLDGWQDAQFLFDVRKNLLEPVPTGESFAPPLYLIAVCSNTPLGNDILAKSNTFYFDVSNIEETINWLQWMQALNAEVQECRQAVRSLQERFDERTAWALDLEDQVKSRDAVIEERQKEIEERRKEIEERTQWAYSLESEIANERAHSKKLSEELAAITGKLMTITASFFYRVFAKLKMIPR